MARTSRTPAESHTGYNYRGLACTPRTLQKSRMITSLAEDRATLPSALRRMLGRGRLVSLLILFTLLVLCLALSWITRDAMGHLSFLKSQQRQDAAAAGPATIVDLHPWQIAQALAPLAVSREEVEYAHEAERLADHEVDQAFATALRQAATQRPTPTGEALELSQRVSQLQQMAKEDTARVHNLTPAPGAPAAEDDLKVAQAQLDLDLDELNDAQQDLARASGDDRTRIQQELTAHQAAMAKTNAQAGNDSQIAVLATRQYTTLAGRVEAWISQRSRNQLIQQALQQANADAAALTLKHNALEAQANANSAAAGPTRPESNGGAVAAARLASLQRRRDQRQLLTIYDDRIQTQQQMEGIYRKWAVQLRLQHRIVMHLALRSLAMIACILMAAIFCEAAGTSLLERNALDRRRMQTLRTILRLSVQLAGIVCVLLVTFGVPSQISTIVGLATAGLTVALQSFILAFFGWFILMGKNGMRVGDWVQINGVAGEVVGIDLFRTTILETSDWADKGHPTGRRATFINNFAITGQFFNFTTVGQWMWDEMSVSIPSSADTYEKIARINQAILDETRQDAELAEQEWKRTPRQNSLGHASAGSSVNMRPAGAGVDILIRYVTRAPDRLEVRNRLYERVIDVLHKPQAVIKSPPSSSSKLTAAVLAAGDSNDRELRDKRGGMYS